MSRASWRHWRPEAVRWLQRGRDFASVESNGEVATGLLAVPGVDAEVAGFILELAFCCFGGTRLRLSPVFCAKSAQVIEMERVVLFALTKERSEECVSGLDRGVERNSWAGRSLSLSNTLYSTMNRVYLSSK